MVVEYIAGRTHPFHARGRMRIMYAYAGNASQASHRTIDSQAISRCESHDRVNHSLRPPSWLAFSRSDYLYFVAIHYVD